TLLDVSLRLISAIYLVNLQSNKIVYYSSFLALNSLIIFIVYVFICNKKIKQLRYVYIRKDNLYKEMLFFNFWTLLTAFSNSLYLYGLNFLLNYYFSPLMNSARGIAMQVFSGLNQVLNTIQLIFLPKILNSYVKDRNYFRKMI